MTKHAVVFPLAICVLSAAFLSPPAQAIDEGTPVAIPVGLKESAVKTFAGGKTYFIWTEQKEIAGKGPAGLPQVLLFPFKFVAKDEKGEPFRAAVSIVSKAEESGTLVPHLVLADSEGYLGPEGDEIAVFAVSALRFGGQGEASLYLVAKADDKQVLSNTIVIRATFPE